jgi:hypothetical protein
MWSLLPPDMWYSFSSRTAFLLCQVRLETWHNHHMTRGLPCGLMRYTHHNCTPSSPNRTLTHFRRTLFWLHHLTSSSDINPWDLVPSTFFIAPKHSIPNEMEPRTHNPIHNRPHLLIHGPTTVCHLA